MGRRILAIVAGAIAAVAIVLLGEEVGRALYLPAGATTQSPSIDEIVAAAPMGAKVLVVFGWFAGAAVGGALAYRLSGWKPAVWTIALMMLAGGIGNVMQIPHPAWMVVGAVVAPLFAIPAAYAIAHWSARRAAGR